MHVLDHDLEAIEEAGLRHLDFLAEALDQVFVDDPVRPRKEREHVLDKELLVVVQLFPVVHVVREVNLLGRPNRRLRLFVKLPRLGLLDREDDESARIFAQDGLLTVLEAERARHVAILGRRARKRQRGGARELATSAEARAIVRQKYQPRGASGEIARSMASQGCRSACYSAMFGSALDQLAIVRASNASAATVVLSRSDAPLRQRRMRAQLERADHGPVVVVVYDFESVGNATRCATRCASASFRSVALSEPSTVAVFLTHVAVNDALLRAPFVDRALVLEDDVLVEPGALRTQLRYALEALSLRGRAGWAYAALGCAAVHRRPTFGLRRGLQPCSRAYLVSRGGMRRIRSHALPMRSPIDYAMIQAFDGETRVYHLKGSPIAHGSEIHGCKRGADF